MAAVTTLQAKVGTGGFEDRAAGTSSPARDPQARRVGLRTATPVGHQWSAAGHGGSAADRWGTRSDSATWPTWAQAQLEQAIAVARAAPAGTSVAGLLFRTWFCAPLGATDLVRACRPLVSGYRSAYAEATRVDGAAPAARHVLGADQWWRTWGAYWTPPRTRPGSVRFLLTPRPDRAADVVTTMTRTLSATTAPWSLSVAARPSRLRRVASAVLDIASVDDVPPSLLAELEPMLRAATAPLALPVIPGVGLIEHATNGMSFGEHRCHLIALALRRGGAPLDTIAAVFAAHGIDPAAPYAHR